MQDKVRSGVLEDRFTGAIESKTSKVQSSGYLAAAFGAITASAILKIVGKDDWALFVGQWPAAFLLMGVYNKMVKQHGSDAYSKAAYKSVGPSICPQTWGFSRVRADFLQVSIQTERATITKFKGEGLCRFWPGSCWV